MTKATKISDSDIKEITNQCAKEYIYALDYRSGRIPAIQENEDLYNLRIQPTLNNRSNYLLPLMPKYIDTLLSKTDDPPVLEFSATEDADKFKAKKCTKAWQFDSSPTRGQWALQDILSKKQAGLYGRVTANYYSYTYQGKYFSVLDFLDFYDFLIDPRAGGFDVENGRYMGIDNIFKGKEYFERKVGDFIDENVTQLFSSVSKDTVKDYDNRNQEKANRYSALNLDFTSYNYQSDQMVKLIEWYTTYNGKRYYVLFSDKLKLAVKVVLLSNMFKTLNINTGLPYWPFASWAIYPSKEEFYTPAPADRLRNNIKAQSVLVNQKIDNNNFQNNAMIAYDEDAIDNPALLKSRPQGTVPMKLGKGDFIQNRIYQFRYPVLSGVDDLYNLLENMNAQGTGITPEAQGTTEKDKKATVYIGDMQQVADRMGLFNKLYSAFYQKLGILYANGLKENYTEETAINVLGDDGIDMEKLLKEDTMPSYDVSVRGFNNEVQMKTLIAERKNKVLGELLVSGMINTTEAIKFILENSEFKSDEIQRLLDKENEGSMKSIVEAKDENQKILKKKMVEPNRAASIIHIRTHLDFVKNNKLEPSEEIAILQHAELEVPIAIKNVSKDIIKRQSNENIGQPTNPNEEIPEQSIGKGGRNSGLPSPAGGQNQSIGRLSKPTGNASGEIAS